MLRNITQIVYIFGVNCVAAALRLVIWNGWKSVGNKQNTFVVSAYVLHDTHNWLSESNHMELSRTESKPSRSSDFSRTRFTYKNISYWEKKEEAKNWAH